MLLPLSERGAGVRGGGVRLRVFGGQLLSLWFEQWLLTCRMASIAKYIRLGQCINVQVATNMCLLCRYGTHNGMHPKNNYQHKWSMSKLKKKAHS